MEKNSWSMNIHDITVEVATNMDFTHQYQQKINCFVTKMKTLIHLLLLLSKMNNLGPTDEA